MSRINALVRSCRRKHIRGQCPCCIEIGECQANDALCQELEQIVKTAADRVRALQSLLSYLNKPAATVRSDWKMPAKPPGDYSLCVHSDVDEWHPHWYSETEQIDCIEFPEESAWPFVEDTADDEDWERLGFEVT